MTLVVACSSFHHEAVPNGTTDPSTNSRICGCICDFSVLTGVQIQENKFIEFVLTRSQQIRGPGFVAYKSEAVPITQNLQRQTTIIMHAGHALPFELPVSLHAMCICIWFTDWTGVDTKNTLSTVSWICACICCSVRNGLRVGLQACHVMCHAQNFLSRLISDRK